MADALHAQVPIEVLQQLAGVAETMGISLPGVTRFAPTIDVAQPIRQLALEMGRLLSPRDIYLKAGEVVTVDPKTGDTQPMTASRFVGWCEEFCAFTVGVRSQRVRDSLTREEASILLDQDIFKGCLRPLDAVHTMRLPVVRESGAIEFLPPGYDVPTRIYTAAVLDYEMDWPLDRATQFLNEHGENYPWSWPDDNRPPIEQNRSWCVHVAAMLGVYCRAMFAPGTPRPMISYVANQPGTGKSTLVAMVLIPVFGEAAATKTPKDDAEMDKELETVAQTLQPYVFFDDIGFGIFSNPLNRFITASSHKGRIMGGNREIFRAPNVTQFFATGNDIKLSSDLMRRSLVAELFLAGDVRGRHFPKTITQSYLLATETRKNFLAAFCSIVRNYVAHVEHTEAAGGSLPSIQGLDSFEQFTSTISAIAQCAGYNDPLLQPDLAGSGSEDDDEIRELLIQVASGMKDDCVFDRKGLVERARDAGLLEPLVGLPGDKDLDATAMKKFGRQLQKWRGRELVDAQGRRFRFSHRRQKKGATYPLAFVRPKGHGEPAPVDLDLDPPPAMDLPAAEPAIETPAAELGLERPAAADAWPEIREEDAPPAGLGLEPPPDD